MSVESRTKRLVSAVQREQSRAARRDELEVQRLRGVVDRRKRKLEQAQRNLAAALDRQSNRAKEKNAGPQTTGR